MLLSYELKLYATKLLTKPQARARNESIIMGLFEGLVASGPAELDEASAVEESDLPPWGREHVVHTRTHTHTHNTHTHTHTIYIYIY